MQLPSKEECTFEFFQKMLFFSLLDKQIIFLKKWIFSRVLAHCGVLYRTHLARECRERSLLLTA